LEVGDVVLVTIKFDPKFPSKGIGLIKEKLNNGEEWVIEIEKEFEDNVESSLLLNLNSREIIKKRSEITKPLELFYK
jgi:ribonucleoside-diphosphate reductase alpha chain